jgi:UrcA family protein
MRRQTLVRKFAYGGIAATALTLFAGSPLWAQTTTSEVTVMGHRGAANSPEEMSYAVSYADLDLRTKAGQDELSKRIRTTADYICKKLDSRARDRNMIANCKAEAERAAMAKADQVEKMAAASSASWKPGPTWSPPPADE